MKVRGFDHNYIKWCTLHTLNLGVAIWAASSAVLELLKIEACACCSKVLRDTCVLNPTTILMNDQTQEVWMAPAGTSAKGILNARLARAYDEFLDFAKQHKLE